MALDFDTTSVPRRPTELTALVRAVVGAHPSDESEWLEWKSTLNLRAAAGRFTVARAILGLANRRPDRAAPLCEGHGFVVVGAEPGQVHGVEELDSADIDDGLSKYLGDAKGPRWHMTYVHVDGKPVLVVTVAPPRRGDPIFPLRKGGESANDGAIFIRRPGKTTPATSADIDDLSARLVDAAPAPISLVVGVAGDLPLRWYDPAGDAAAVAEYLDREAGAMLADATAIDEERRKPKQFDVDQFRQSGGLASAALAADSFARFAELGLGSTPDRRSLQDFEAEVAEWKAKAQKRAASVLRHRYLSGRNALRFTIKNPTDKHLADVQLKVMIEGDVRGLEERPNEWDFPAPPRRFGERVKSAASGAFDFPGLNPRHLPTVDTSAAFRRQWIEDGSLKFTWDVGPLRPTEQDESEEIWLLVGPEASRPLVADWEATTPSADGVLRGTVQIPVEPTPVTARGLLELDER